MQRTLDLKCPLLLPSLSLPVKANGNVNVSPNQSLLAKKSSSLLMLCDGVGLLVETHKRKTVVCARNKGRRPHGLGRSRKLMFQSACFIASKLKIFPEPLDLFLRELGAGSGGGIGSQDGFGWGGSDGWGRKRKGKFGILGILVIFVVVVLYVFGNQLVDTEFLLGGLGLFLFGLSVDGWRRGVKDWIVGFCCGAALTGLMLHKREDFQKWVRSLWTMKTNRRRRRRTVF